MIDPRNYGTDFSEALTSALATGQPVNLFEQEQPYILTKPVAIPENAELYGVGRPRIVVIGDFHGPALYSSGNNIVLRDLIVEFDPSTNFDSWALQLFHEKAQIDNLQIYKAPRYGILISGDENHISTSTISCGRGAGIKITGNYNRIENVDLSANKAFGCYLDEGAKYNLLQGLYCKSSGLELVGITYSCKANQIISCHAERTGDNGFSITGSENIVMGCYATLCKHSGIRIYGSRNTITGNICRDNGQRSLQDNTVWSGIDVSSEWGGLASNNSIIANICFDDQQIKTQAYGIRIGLKGYYPSWKPNTQLDGYPYRSFGRNFYKYKERGITGNITPTHTSGEASDGSVTWIYVATADNDDFSPTGNVGIDMNVS